MRFISFFSGIEAASVAWLPLGWECAAVAEIDKFACAVLAHHYPDVPNLGDIKKITREKIAELGPIDLAVFGFPCQDLSVAGKRAGLKGERSGLFFDAMRIVEWCRELYGTRWTVVENVPGLFSSHGGADFAAVVGELAGAEFDVPKSKWQNTGVALGPRGLVSWSVLDAQWFGVPQRRRRVFLVRDSGDWRRSRPVLFEHQSLQGNPPPGREKGQGTTYDVAPCVGASGRGFERAADTRGQDCLIPSHDPAMTLNARDYKGPLPEADLSTVVCHTSGIGYWQEGFGTLRARTQDSHENLVAHALRADGFDASEDGTGRGTPLVPVGYMPYRTYAADGGIDSGFAEREVCDAVHTATGNGNKSPLIAFTAKDYGADASPLSPTLRAGGFTGSHANAGVMPAIAFNLRGREGGSQLEPDPDGMANIRAASGGSSRTYVAYGLDSQLNSEEEGIGPLTIGSASGGGQPARVATQMAVRRLTPREAERLQGFPDNYTLIPYGNRVRKEKLDLDFIKYQMRGNPKHLTREDIDHLAADGPRYKALGNSMAVPVMRWIGKRIDLVEQMQDLEWG